MSDRNMTDGRSIFTSSQDLKYHLLTFGVTGKGRSSFTREIAEREGVSYKEVELRFQLTKDEFKHREIERETKIAADNKRLQLVRDAYWSGSSLSEFDRLHDAIVSLLEISPTQAQIQTIFNLLPGTVIGMAVQWGMSDTVVGDECYNFIENNDALIRHELGLNLAD